MTSGQSTESSIDRDSTTASRLSPEPPKRPVAPVAGATLDRGRNFKPGRPKSLGHRSAVRWLQRGAVSEVAPSRRTGSRAVRLAPAVADWLAPRTYSVPDQRCHTRPPTRSGRTALKRKRPGGDRRYTAECPPSEESTRPRTHVGIPGPDVCRADADTPTSTALAPCGVQASRLVSVGTNSNGSPTATDVAVSLASWRHEDATCGPRCSVAAARPNRCSGAPLRARCRGLAARRCRRAATLRLAPPGGSVKSRYLSRGQTWKDEPSPHPSPRGWRMRLGGTSPWRATYHVPAHEGRHGLSG